MVDQSVALSLRLSAAGRQADAVEAAMKAVQGDPLELNPAGATRG